MQNQVINFPRSEVRICDSCGGNGVRMSFEHQTFNYGTGDHLVKLSARVPVWTCEQCGDQFTDHTAEELRHAAVCKHLGRLAPREIIDLRNSYGLAQSEWAAITGFGVASVKRWETGTLIQGASSDKLMRLLKDRRNFDALNRIEGEHKQPKAQVSKFRTLLPTDAPIHALSFALRRAPEALQRA
jgi:putative zinc finger/helix-turn-helix YgiT family protein